MTRLLVLLFLSLFVFGCEEQPENKIVLAKINNFEITQEEFEKEFRESPFGRQNDLKSRKDFLDNMINRKLVLQDAQVKGLDKDKDFLKMIEKFWEQSLLKLTLDKKSKEIAGAAIVSDKTVEETYQRMVKEGRVDKPYDQMYNQIKWEITKLKETQMMNDWIAELRRKADIKVDYNLLEQAK